MSSVLGRERMVEHRLALERARLHEADALLRTPEVADRLGAAVVRSLHQLIDPELVSQTVTSNVGWSHLRDRTRRIDAILAECLAAVVGAYTDTIPLVGGACAEALVLADELHELTGLATDRGVVPAEAECAGVATSVLRRRFPDHGVWDLPVVAHEFGHLVARDLVDVDVVTGDTSRSLAEYLAGRLRQSAELAADVFAVFVLGPAYALTLVLHRMDPTAPAVSAPDATHPGDASRVAAVVHALRLLAAADPPERRRQYDFLLTALPEWWAEAQADVPAEARLDEQAADRVRRETDGVWGRLMRSKLAGTRYTTFVTARDLADARPEWPRHEGGPSCRDVLNAAWLVRFRAWRDDRPSPADVETWARRQLKPSAREGSHGR